MIFFLMEVSGDQEDSDEEGSEAWVNMIDRGGLYGILTTVCIGYSILWRRFYWTETTTCCFEFLALDS